jgi:hypothetical protein
MGCISATGKRTSSHIDRVKEAWRKELSWPTKLAAAQEDPAFQNLRQLIHDCQSALGEIRKDHGMRLMNLERGERVTLEKIDALSVETEFVNYPPPHQGLWCNFCKLIVHAVWDSPADEFHCEECGNTIRCTQCEYRWLPDHMCDVPPKVTDLQEAHRQIEVLKLERDNIGREYDKLILKVKAMHDDIPFFPEES